MEARIAELEKFRVDSHIAITAHGTMIKINNGKAAEFIVITERNEAQVTVLAEEVDSHAKKINGYENGKLSAAQLKTVNSMSVRVADMTDSMKLMFTESSDSMRTMITESVETLTKAPRHYIGGSHTGDMNYSEDLPPTLTGTRNIQIEHDGTLNDASAVKIPNP